MHQNAYAGYVFSVGGSLYFLGLIRCREPIGWGIIMDMVARRTTHQVTRLGIHRAWGGMRFLSCRTTECSRYGRRGALSDTRPTTRLLQGRFIDDVEGDVLDSLALFL